MASETIGREPSAPPAAADASARSRRGYQLVLPASLALLGLFLLLIGINAYRAEYQRQLQLQASRIASVGARVEEIADVARARVTALRHTTALTYSLTPDAPGADVPLPAPAPYSQIVSAPRNLAEQVYQGTILAHPLQMLPQTPDPMRAWRQDYRVFRALWLAQAGLHAASRHVALSYIVSARTGATANFPILSPQGLAAILDPHRARPASPIDTPFLHRLSPQALPSRALVWLPVYYDPTSALARVDADVKGDGRVISLIAPVDVQGRYRAGVGVDIWAEEMAQILRNSSSEAQLTLVDGAGLVIATTRAEARRLKAGTIGETRPGTDAAALLGVPPSTLSKQGEIREHGRLLYILSIPNTPFRLVGQLPPTALRNTTLRNLGPLIAGAALLYLLLCLAIWYVTQRVFEPAFALAEHLRTLGSGPAPRLPGYWARVLAVTQSAFAERRQLEEELARQREALHQSEKMTALGTLLAGVAHELNNPLAVVVGRSAILAEALEGTPHARGIGKLRDAADRCSRIVKTFLAMARRSGPRRATIDLNELVENALDVTAYGLRTAGITVTCDLDPGLPLTHADGDQIVQILMNLIINAQHALAAHVGTQRRLTIATRRGSAAETIQVMVSDNGPGVPIAIRGQIFDPFFTTKQVGQGTGMGLAVSRGMAEAQGGTLELLPSPKGAAFQLTLPIAHSLPSGNVEDAAPATPVPSSQRALVVDDETEVGELIRDSLQDLFAEVDLHRDGRAALAAMDQRSYDLVISDLRMPGMSGIELYQEIVSSHPDLGGRFLFVSGDIQYRQELRGSIVADLPVLEKPFAPDELRSLVSELLLRRSRETQPRNN
jgi:C4-dicarboxylate-specific signal transduction histidine kinase/CheY-like chemotaxis protein